MARGSPTLSARVTPQAYQAFLRMCAALLTSPSELTRTLIEHAVDGANTCKHGVYTPLCGVCTAGSLVGANHDSEGVCTPSEADSACQKGVCTQPKGGEGGKGGGEVLPSMLSQDAQPDQPDQLMLEGLGLPEDQQPRLARAARKAPGAQHDKDPRVRSFLVWYAQRWGEAHRGNQYVIAWSRDGAHAKRLLAALPSEQLAARVERFLACDDDFLRSTGMDLAAFARFHHRFADQTTDTPAPGAPAGLSAIQRARQSRGESTP